MGCFPSFLPLWTEYSQNWNGESCCRHWTTLDIQPTCKCTCKCHTYPKKKKIRDCFEINLTVGELPFKWTQCSLRGEVIIPLDLTYSILDQFHLLSGTTVGAEAFTYKHSTSLQVLCLRSLLSHRYCNLIHWLKNNLIWLYFWYLPLQTLMSLLKGSHDNMQLLLKLCFYSH